MTKVASSRSLLIVVAAALTIGGAILGPAPVLAQTQLLNVQDADIRVFIQDVAKSTGTTFIIDPRVKGTVTVASNGPLNRRELFEVFLATLRANNFVATPAGNGAYRIEPSENAARQPSAAGGQFATEVFRLRTLDAASAVEMLKPLVGPQGQVVANPRGAVVVVADYADNVRRIRGLLAQVDQDRAMVHTVTLTHSSAREIAQVLNDMLTMPGAEGKSGRGAVTVVAVDSSNSVLLRGDSDAVQRLLPVIADLDRRAESSDDVRVVFLRHANAEQMLPVLQQLVGQATTSVTTSSSRGLSNVRTATGAPPASTATATPIAATASANGPQATIARFPGANALIINAPPETQRTLAEVIRQLDVRREQVLVEAIVVEVTDGAAKQLGVQFLLGGTNGTVPFVATNYTNATPSLLPLVGAAATTNSGADTEALKSLRDAAVSSLLTASGVTSGVYGRSGDALFGAIINAVKKDTGSNLLSTPSIMTLDNEEARILVGQEVPITTGEVLGDSNANPFRTIQRQNVGIQLEVKPQINAGGGITLFLRQEVSSVAGPVSVGSSELIINKREIETTALVDDGDIVVLGGLLDQQETQSAQRTPGLGEVPGLGALFRSTAHERKKTNLMVFIRPRIIRSSADARDLTAPRYDYMRNLPPMTTQDGDNSLDAVMRDYLNAARPVASSAPISAVPAAAKPATTP
ncbi:general secretion pathway protein D [Caulobacter sp. BE264]|uniref:type II secretion system secretin GspD n=1 Tax=Caulobacter sp. BE264 TaxID=2817724 RepID=UPI002861B173|nr:type II secretion system secretin GspD [Caulobacter sp. BE264]MDR7229903.1 general secretion pathway protein D [Caulobacter sp. BE264]